VKRVGNCGRRPEPTSIAELHDYLSTRQSSEGIKRRGACVMASGAVVQEIPGWRSVWNFFGKAYGTTRPTGNGSSTKFGRTAIPTRCFEDMQEKFQA